MDILGMVAAALAGSVGSGLFSKLFGEKQKPQLPMFEFQKPKFENQMGRYDDLLSLLSQQNMPMQFPQRNIFSGR